MASPKKDFGFGFNEPTFSDRLLHIQVINDSFDSNVDVVEVQTVHINSLVVSASSPFFFKLLTNGMKETAEMDLILQVPQSEVGPLMEVLKFVYTNTLSEPATEHLMGVLMVADKFEFTSCMRCCIELLKEKPMSLESALLYLQLPASISSSEVVQPLLVSAKEYLAATYSDIGQSWKKMMDLPLCGIEVVLGSKGLKVEHEDEVLEFVLEWACQHYPRLEERQQILATLVAKCVCFSCMSISKLKEVLASAIDFGDEQIIQKLVNDALFFKASTDEEVCDTKCTSLGRIYELRPVKLVRFEHCRPCCVVYFNLSKQECENLSSKGDSQCIASDEFLLGGQLFCLFVDYNHSSVENEKCFGMYLQRKERAESCSSVDIEFAVLSNSTNKFEVMFKDNMYDSDLKENQGNGVIDLLGITWSEFMSEDCDYFVDGKIHLRTDLTVKKYDVRS